nr:hypothetical protein [Tanacetum cinerariifolium]
VRLPSICVIIGADGYAYTGSDDWLIDVGHVCLSVGADGAQSSRVPVLLPEVPYEAIRQAYLVGMDTESEPFEGEARTPESPHIVAPPTCHVEESESSGTSDARSTSLDSIAPLLPDHPLTHTTPALVPILRRTSCIVVHVPPAMSPGLSAGIAEVAAMSDSAFRKRFTSSYDSLPSPTLPVQKRYKGTSKLILGTDSEEDEEVEEILDSKNKSEGAEDEGPTTKDKDPAAGDEGLARVEVLGVDDESYSLDDESYGLDDESHGVDDESRGLDDKGRSVEIDGLSLEEENEAIPGGQGSGFTPEPERSERVSAFRQPTLTTWTDLEDDMVYIDVPVYPPSTPPVQTPPSPEWTFGSLPISPSPSVVPSPVSSPMIPLTVPSPIALPMATSTATISDHTQRLDAMPSTLFAEIDRDERTVVTFGALWRPVMALKAWIGHLLTARAAGDKGSCDCVGAGDGP